MADAISGCPELSDLQITCKSWRTRKVDLESSLVLGPISTSLEKTMEFTLYMLQERILPQSQKRTCVHSGHHHELGADPNSGVEQEPVRPTESCMCPEESLCI